MYRGFLRGGDVIEHPFDAHAVAPGRVVDKHMGHRAHQSAVLNDRAAAHALHDAPGACQQRRIGHVDHDGAQVCAALALQALNFAIIGAHRVVHGGENLRTAGVHLAARAHGQALWIEGTFFFARIVFAKHAIITVAGHAADLLFLRQKIAHDLAGRAALAPAHLHNLALIQAALRHGQQHSRVHIRNVVSQCAEGAGFRIHKRERAHARSAGAHPGADARLAIPRVCCGCERE